MNQVSLSFLEKLPDGVEDRIERGHIRDEAAKGIVCNYKRFHIVANHQNELAGVLTAYTAFSEVYVDGIWVDPSYRKQGIGSRLLEELERRFSGKGYNNINSSRVNLVVLRIFIKSVGLNSSLLGLIRRTVSFQNTFS